jgi:hypothetical protein
MRVLGTKSGILTALNIAGNSGTNDFSWTRTSSI